MRRTISLIIGVLISVVFIVYALAVEPALWIQENSYSWLIVRAISAALAVVLAYLSFTGGEPGGYRQIQIEKRYLKDKNNADLKAEGYTNFEIRLIEAPMISYIIWWIICFEIITSFYIADWCPTGF